MARINERSMGALSGESLTGLFPFAADKSRDFPPIDPQDFAHRWRGARNNHEDQRLLLRASEMEHGAPAGSNLPGLLFMR
jgi:hypothetical protein